MALRLPSCYLPTMQKEPKNWRGTRAARDLKRLKEIEASIRALKDNDLLDFADIFVQHPGSALSEIAADEMATRKISL